jgi:hypothetical protein
MTCRSIAVRASSQSGVALVIAVMTMTLVLAVGLALTLLAMTDAKIAAGYRDGSEALSAAEGAIELVMQEFRSAAGWTPILDGRAVSRFVDGAPEGRRRLADGRSIDLAAVTGAVVCGRATCSDADMDAKTGDRRWGANNPRWRLYAYGTLDGMVGRPLGSRSYVVVWVGDDPAENDGDPLLDGGSPRGCDPADPVCINPGAGIIVVRAQAFAADGVSRSMEVTLSMRKPRDGGPRIVSWRAVR